MNKLIILALSFLLAGDGKVVRILHLSPPQWTTVLVAGGSGTIINTANNINLVSGTVTAGSTIIATANGWAGSTWVVTSITPNGGTCGSAFAAQKVSTFSTTNTSEIWAAPNCSSAITSLTFNFSGGGTMACSWLAVSPMPTTIIVDASNSTSGASSGVNPNGTPVTSTKANDFYMTSYDHASTISNVAPTGWTLTCPACSNEGSAYLTSSSAAAGTYTPTSWTVASGSFAGATVAFATQ